MRYRLGPSIGPISVITATPPADQTDLIATLVSSTPKAITLAFPAYDPATVVPPVESRTYFLPVGLDIPKDADAWVASGAPFGSATKPVDAGGDPAYIVPGPAVEPADYFGQVVHCYP